MIVASGTVSIDLDVAKLGGVGSQMRTLNYTSVPDTFFTVLVFNNEFRSALPSVMELVPSQARAIGLPGTLNASARQLVVESTPWSSTYDLVVRDGKTGFVYFNVEGHQFEYEVREHSLTSQSGRLILSSEYAAQIGRETGTVVGNLSINATMRAIEVTEIVNGDVKSDVLPANEGAENGTNPGPDVIVGDLTGLAQFDSSSGTRVGLAIGTDSCNAGTVDLNWFALPDNDHPVIPQNLYRMSGGASNNERFEQIGQSNVKHAFTALTGNICGFGCNGVGGPHLGSGCSDPYGAGLNSGPSLGSRAWINPFTGSYPRGDSGTPPNSHSGHSHQGPSHRVLTEIADLNTSLNAGATYYAEAQYITPHEYVWCQAHPTQCNMYNNVSYRKYNVSGTGSPFNFSANGATQRMQTAISAWTGASFSQINPAPGVDGIGIVGYKVTGPVAGIYHYEYAIYNQNLDRAIRSFSIPLGASVVLTNLGFHAPPQHPGWTADGTTGNTGFSSAPWTSTQAGGTMTWNSETFAQNPNANAIRWGTLYNIRFDSDRPPMYMNATVGFLKTGSPVNVLVLGPRTNLIPCLQNNPDTITACG
jgi:hypothetical protein